MAGTEAGDREAYDWQLIDRKGELLGTIRVVSPSERCWAETDHSAPIHLEATAAFEAYRPLFDAWARAEKAYADRLDTWMKQLERTAGSQQLEAGTSDGRPPKSEADPFRKEIREGLRLRDSDGVWEFLYLYIDGDCGRIRGPNLIRCQWNGSGWVPPRQRAIMSGKGSTVCKLLHLERGTYKVAWSAQGHDNFDVHIVLGDQKYHLVKAIPPNPASGETLFNPHQDANYTLHVQAATLEWKIAVTPI